MPDKKYEQSGFKVTDRRLFTPEGELRADVEERVEAPKPVNPIATKDAPPAEKSPTPVAVDAGGVDTGAASDLSLIHI